MLRVGQLQSFVLAHDLIYVIIKATFLALYLLKEKIRLLSNSYKANQKYIFGNGNIPPDVHVHEHLLNKRMMHMHMHIQ